MTAPLGIVATLSAAAAVTLGSAAFAGAPTIRLAGQPRLHAVQGDVGVGRPTAYVTFRTAEGVNARSIVVRVWIIVAESLTA